MTGPVTPELLEALIDDAGLFPPEQLAMTAALARHWADEAAGHLMLTDRFLCPASRLGELAAGLDAGAPGGTGVGLLRLGVILDTGLDSLPDVVARVAAEPRLALEGISPRD